MDGINSKQGLQVAQNKVVFLRALQPLSSCLYTKGTAPSTRTPSSILYLPDRAIITKSGRTTSHIVQSFIFRRGVPIKHSSHIVSKAQRNKIAWWCMLGQEKKKTV